MIRHGQAPASSMLALLWLSAYPLVLWANEFKPQPKDAEPTDPDYAVQGEYVGKVFTAQGETLIGVQVFALGKGKFWAASYLDGLPGEGWDRTPRGDGQAKTKGDVTDFNIPGVFSCTIQNRLLSIKLAEGVNVAELKKIDRESPTLGEKPPEGAVVLFDGSTADKFEQGQLTEDGLLLPGCHSKEKFGSGKLHVEFRVPFMPERTIRRTATAASTCKDVTKCRCSIPSDYANRTPGAARSIRCRPPTKTCAIRPALGRPTTSTSRRPNTPTAKK